jgi:hypothetical protein
MAHLLLVWKVDEEVVHLDEPCVVRHFSFAAQIVLFAGALLQPRERFPGRV